MVVCFLHGVNERMSIQINNLPYGLVDVDDVAFQNRVSTNDVIALLLNLYVGEDPRLTVRFSVEDTCGERLITKAKSQIEAERLARSR